ncbi:hypothetical protein J2741_000293 [Methanolinea mesophila]|uniref:hypothetical protein n=1 Tax=Methanolinea mesophila TaxID=547055 RepID=UPI001AEA046D|nr:hypothetical protein [Methanolinea mesophila]MBP1927746.1 hypothetical protein [Methanolinea mesophila]
MADTGVPQVPETQGFTTSTAISAVGTITETDSVVNIIANAATELLGPLPFPLGEWGAYGYLAEYTSAYTEETVADQGLVSYTKTMTTDTSGMATTDLFNVQTDKLVEFIGTDTGRMTSGESSVLDGAGLAFYNSDIMICPFASPNDNVNPDFCSIVQEGSSVDLTLGSLATRTDQRYIMESAGHPPTSQLFEEEVPISDAGVESNYAITLKGLGDVPAMGSVESHIDVHVQEGRLYFIPEDYLVDSKAEDLVYSETTTASGDITLFRKVLGYTSKITAPGQSIPRNL